MLRLGVLRQLPKRYNAQLNTSTYDESVVIRINSTVCELPTRRQFHYSPRRWQSTVAQTSNGPSYLLHPGSVELTDQTLGQLLDQAANRWPNREAIVSIHQNIRLTFAEVRRRADKLAAGLLQLGLKRGDRVGIWGPNNVEWYLTFMASARVGLITVGINPAYQPSEVEYCLQKVGARAVVSPATFKTQNYTEMLLSARRKCPTLEHVIICADHHTPGARRYADVESLAGTMEEKAIAAEQSEIPANSGCNIQFTSGTTGRPKATLLSHKSLTNNSRQGSQRSELDVGYQRICGNVPFFHAFGVVMVQVASLHAGATVVLPGPSFKPENSLNIVVQEKCTVVYGTPTMWVDMINMQHHVNAPIGKIFTGTTGGSPASPELFRRIRETLHCDNMKSIFGLTETTAIAFQSLPGEERLLAETTVGHLSDHLEAQVVDENGVPVPLGTPGELWIRGYSTMMRYWDDEESTRKTLTADGWLKTGDQFILRHDGYGHIVGRLKDMVIRGGENIFPKEIEEFLETHPAVLESQVFGVHDDRLGEEICACVRLRKGAVITEEVLKKYANGKIAHFKIPKYIHFTDEFPKTTSGKVPKYLLREALEARGTVPTRPKY